MTVAITGLGAITPVGVGADATWSALCNGDVGIADARTWLQEQLPGFERLRTNLAGRIHDYDLLGDPALPFETVLSRKAVERELSRAAVLAVRACAEALTAAGLLSPALEPQGLDGPRFAVMLGSGIGGASALRPVTLDLQANKRPHSTQMYQLQPDNPTVVVKRLFGARGPSLGLTQACASGGVAIALAAMLLERGDVDVALTGGAEGLDASVVALFEATGASTDSTDPRAVRPLDVDPPGAIISEGAGAVVLERLDDARARGARVLGLIDGFAITGGGGSPSMMEEEGLVRAMRLALERSSLPAGAAVAISPHATGTRAGDQAEANAIREVMERTPVSRVFPVKGSLGHTIGASGGIEAVLSVLALEHDVVPPAATSMQPLDTMRDLMPGADAPAPLAADAVLSNSMGFGDQTVSLVFRRATG